MPSGDLSSQEQTTTSFGAIFKIDQSDIARQRMREWSFERTAQIATREGLVIGAEGELVLAQAVAGFCRIHFSEFSEERFIGRVVFGDVVGSIQKKSDLMSKTLAIFAIFLPDGRGGFFFSKRQIYYLLESVSAARFTRV